MEFGFNQGQAGKVGSPPQLTIKFYRQRKTPRSQKSQTSSLKRSKKSHKTKESGIETLVFPVFLFCIEVMRQKAPALDSITVSLFMNRETAMLSNRHWPWYLILLAPVLIFI